MIRERRVEGTDSCRQLEEWEAEAEARVGHNMEEGMPARACQTGRAGA